MHDTDLTFEKDVKAICKGEMQKDCFLLSLFNHRVRIHFIPGILNGKEYQKLDEFAVFLVIVFRAVVSVKKTIHL
jgi:hypothetical protein